jgi:hypothetical protein
MKKTNLLVAAAIAVATVLAAGLAVLPSSVQDAQAIGTQHCQLNEQGISAEFVDGDQTNEVDCDLENVGSIDNN